MDEPTEKLFESHSACLDQLIARGEEVDSLREINAELLAALRDAREVMRLAFNDVPGWTDAYADAMGRSDAAIARAEKA